MNLKNLPLFALGVMVGAGLLFAYDHRHDLKGSFRNPEEIMQASVSGQWQGTLQVNGTDVVFSLAITKAGDALTGVLSAPQVGDIPCDEIRIDPEGHITFSAHVNDKSATFTGKVATGTHAMTGNFTSNAIGTGGWSLTRPQT
jgi:hypothetical protein